MHCTLHNTADNTRDTTLRQLGGSQQATRHRGHSRRGGSAEHVAPPPRAHTVVRSSQIHSQTDKHLPYLPLIVLYSSLRILLLLFGVDMSQYIDLSNVASGYGIDGVLTAESLASHKAHFASLLYVVRRSLI